MGRAVRKQAYQEAAVGLVQIRLRQCEKLSLEGPYGVWDGYPEFGERFNGLTGWFGGKGRLTAVQVVLKSVGQGHPGLSALG